jgi:hypothetical protein
MRKLIAPFVMLLAISIVSFSSYTLIAQSKGDLKIDVVDPNEDVPLAIDDQKVKFDELKIYSSNGELKISFTNDLQGKVLFQLYDITGRKLSSEEKIKSNSKMEYSSNISSLPHSFYIVRLTQGNKQSSKKIYL